jgi:hypothetical protein
MGAGHIFIFNPDQPIIPPLSAILQLALSLFYFDKGIRLKLLLNQGSRTSQQIKNEIIIRKKIENSPLCIPEILESNLEKTPFWFVDQLVMGEKIQWNHPKASQILIEILTNMWGFYQSTGIVWETLRNRGIDITKVVDDFCILKRKDKDIFGKTNFDLNKIRSFANKFVSSSLIHGDLSIGNVIVLGNKNYIIDWELARNDFIIRDFYKTLKARWDLYNELNEIMNKGIENYFGKDKQQVLNLEDQYLLEQFLSAYARANNVYARYAPWTDILDNCDKIRS